MKRPPFLLRRIVLGVAALTALWVVYEQLLAPDMRDMVWRHELLSALDAAATVKVVEHSTAQEQFRVGHPAKVYATVTLNAEQTTELRRLFSQVRDGTPRFGTLNCLFEEHHYVEMTARDGRTRTVLLCFECGQFYLGNKSDDQWTYAELGKMSESWKSSMSRFIVSLGLHPDGPWWGPDAIDPQGRKFFIQATKP